eukprot:397245-Pelagomonas_calceolata.AAC.7
MPGAIESLHERQDSKPSRLLRTGPSGLVMQAGRQNPGSSAPVCPGEMCRHAHGKQNMQTKNALRTEAASTALPAMKQQLESLEQQLQQMPAVQEQVQALEKQLQQAQQALGLGLSALGLDEAGLGVPDAAAMPAKQKHFEVGRPACAVV